MGGHVAEYLFQQGEISKATFRKGAHLKVLDQNGVQVIEADLLDHHSMHEAVEGCDVVYSMASPMPGEDEDFEKVNTEGAMSLLEVAQEMKVKTVVHLGTLDVHGTGEVDQASGLSPSEGYQKGKASAERVFLEFAKRSTEPRVLIVRAAKAIGSGEPSVVVPVLRMIEDGKVVLPESGAMSWTHPKDIGQAMLKASASTLPTGTALLVKSFDATPREVADGLVKAVGGEARFRAPGLLAKSPLSEYAAQQLRSCVRLAAQPSWKDLGYSPEYDLARTAQEIAQWYRKEPWVTERNGR